MHINRGLPLISAEHEPHFPALQFQRTAKSGACSAWMACTASSTTIPSPAATWYSFSSPRSRVPRNRRSLRRSGTTQAPSLISVSRSGELKERSEEHTSELQSQSNLVCRLLLEKKKRNRRIN